MNEVSWHVGIHISRTAVGDVHWYVDGSDGLSGGYLIDEAHCTTLTAAVLAARRCAFGALIQEAAAQEQLDAKVKRPPAH